MKYICGSARGDKLLNCVCGRFMARTEGGGQAGGPRRQPPSPSPQGHRAREGGSGARAGGTAGTTCKPGVNDPATDLQVTGSLASAFRADSAARGRASQLHLPARPRLLALRGGSAPFPALPPRWAAGVTLLAAPGEQTPLHRLEGFHPVLSLDPAPEPAPGSGQTPSSHSGHAPSAQRSLPASLAPSPDPPCCAQSQQQQPAALPREHAGPSSLLSPQPGSATVTVGMGSAAWVGRGTQTGARAGTVLTCPVLGPAGSSPARPDSHVHICY